MAENKYKAKLIKKLEILFPGCFIIKNDASHRQGVPDLLVLYFDKWAMLEVKDSEFAMQQPNQEYYVRMLDEMSFAAFIYPENEEGVLYDLQQSFEACRSARVPRR